MNQLIDIVEFRDRKLLFREGQNIGRVGGIHTNVDGRFGETITSAWYEGRG